MNDMHFVNSIRRVIQRMFFGDYLGLQFSGQGELSEKMAADLDLERLFD